MQVHNHYGITKRCQGNPQIGENMMQEKGFQDAGQKSSTTSTFDGYNKPSKNPKIQALLNEIINASAIYLQPQMKESILETVNYSSTTSASRGTCVTEYYHQK